MYGPDALCIPYAVMGSGLHACIGHSYFSCILVRYLEKSSGVTSTCRHSALREACCSKLAELLDVLGVDLVNLRRTYDDPSTGFRSVIRGNAQSFTDAGSPTLLAPRSNVRIDPC